MPDPTSLLPSRRELTRWLVRVARPVLGPHGASTALRLVEQLAGLALFAVGIVGMLRFATDDPPRLWALAAVLIGLSLLKALSRYLEQFLGHLVAFKALELLRGELFARLWPQAPAVVARSRSGDLLERATKDVDRIEVFFAHTLAPAVTAVLTPLVATLAIGWTVSWPVAGVMGLGLALTVVALPLVGARTTREAAVATAELRGRLAHSVTDSVQGLAEVTGYGLEEDRLAHAARLGGEIGRQAGRVTRVAVVRRVVAILLGMATVLGMVVVGHSSLVGLAVAVVLAIRCFDITRSVEDFLTDLDASFASAGRLWTLTHTRPAVGDPAEPEELPAGPLDVAWEDVTFTYVTDGDVAPEPAVTDVKQAAAAGRHTCLVGASGAGKSTLAQLVLRYADPARGRVLLGGVDVARLRLADLRGAVAHVSQRPFLFNASVRENLRLARPEATDDEIRLACEQAHIHEHVESLPQGYDTHVGELGGRWSGGQRARLALARALVTRARVFILDEYTAHLDEELAGRLADSLREARPDATIIEITHRVASSLSADRIIVLDGGRVVQSGTPSELASTDGPYAQLLARDEDSGTAIRSTSLSSPRVGGGRTSHTFPREARG